MRKMQIKVTKNILFSLGNIQVDNSLLAGLWGNRLSCAFCTNLNQ